MIASDRSPTQTSLHTNGPGSATLQKVPECGLYTWPDPGAHRMALELPCPVSLLHFLYVAFILKEGAQDGSNSGPRNSASHSTV